ncbi:MAG TPA: carbohydrate porin, partial [Acetobacteraceae bacterium]
MATGGNGPGTLGAGVAVLLVAAMPQASRAQAPVPAANPGAPPASTQSEPGFMTNLWTRNNLFGDLGGLRSALGKFGISLSLQTSDEILGNVSGGVKRGASGDGLTTLDVQLDTQKAFGWEGGTFNASVLWIYGPNFSQGYLDNLQTASGIAASPTVRLWEVWYQQAFLDGRADVKLGQQSVDQEFMVSTYSSLFLNTVMGWPMVPSADLYAGGPAYPLSSLGVRLRDHPTNAVTVLGGVFQDNPPGGPFDDDSQLRGSTRWGGNFNLRTGALIIGEIQYALNQPAVGQMTSANQPSGLPGTYKLGFWYDTALFPDQRFDSAGLSLANPASNGVARMHRGNFSFYAVADQAVWQPDAQGPRSLGVFARLMGAPADRNLVSFSVDAGLNLKDPLPGRDSDSFGVGFGVAKVSGVASGLDGDTGFFTGTAYPVRGSETFIEVTYQYQIAPWWQVQPDFQYVFMPSGGVPDPVDPGRRIGNEAVFGL